MVVEKKCSRKEGNALMKLFVRIGRALDGSEFQSLVTTLSPKGDSFFSKRAYERSH